MSTTVLAPLLLTADSLPARARERCPATSGAREARFRSRDPGRTSPWRAMVGEEPSPSAEADAPGASGEETP